MGIIDKVTALVQGRGERRRDDGGRADALALRDDFDRWVQGLFENPLSLALGGSRWSPSVDVAETADEVVITAELPGLDRKDIDVDIKGDVLVIRGEKREQREDARRDYRVLESRYGQFVRTVPLPAGVDRDRAEARVRDGVLTVRFPKVSGDRGARRIPIRT
jgi:HSP20 family protein